MITPDIILVIVLVVFIAFILNINIRNAKKIRNEQSQEQLNKLKQATTTPEVSSKSNDSKALDDSNYLHDLFNSDSNISSNNEEWRPVSVNTPIVLKEVTEDEVSKPTKAFGKVKKESPYDYDNAYYDEYTINSVSNIVNKQDYGLDEYDEYEDDYAIGVDDEEDVVFNNALSEEFSSLSPEMKAFIMSNLMKNKTTGNDGDRNDI